MQTTVFKRKSCNGQRVDRFVVPRVEFAEIRRRWTTNHERGSVDIWYNKYLKKKNYTNYLDQAFGLEPLMTPENKSELEDVEFTWPCVPRKKTYLSSVDSILDLPTYSYATFPDLLDWSSDNILVAALGRQYHKWSWRTQSLISQGIALNNIQCCKFDPRGEMLILGTAMRLVEIHNTSTSKYVAGNSCRCFQSDNLNCSITAVDWSPTGNSFATGCVRGVLMAFDRTARVISWRRVFRSAILIIRVSPDARYVAVSAVNDEEVLILTWPGLEFVTSLISDCTTIKALAWHPWRSAFLGIGAVSLNHQARIALVDVPPIRVQDNNLGRRHYSLDAMQFSHRTGELVLSLWNTDPAVSYQKACSNLVVMSDPKTVVDRWGEGRSGLDRVRTMVFSPDGTKLATATADEDLIIWNFLPEDKQKKKKTNCRRFSALPVYLDEAMQGFSLR